MGIRRNEIALEQDQAKQIQDPQEKPFRREPRRQDDISLPRNQLDFEQDPLDVERRAFEAVDKPFTFGEAFEASIKQAFENTFTTKVIQDFFAEQQLGGGPLIDPGDLNDEFGDLVDTKFNRAMTREQALRIVDKTRRRRDLDQIINQADVGAFGSAGLFGASLLGSLADPGAIVLGLGLGGVVAKGAGALASRGFNNFFLRSFTAAGGSATTGQLFTRGLTEATLESVITEPIIANIRRKELEEVTQQEVLANIGLNIATFGGFFAGIHGAAGILRSMGVNANNLAADGASSQLESNKKVDVDTVFDQLATERSGEFRSRGPGDHLVLADKRRGLQESFDTFEFRPVSRSEIDTGLIKQRRFFVSSTSRQIKPGVSTAITRNFDTTVQATDNPFVANNLAGSPIRDKGASIKEVQFKKEKPNLIIGEQRASQEVADAFDGFAAKIEQEPIKNAFNSIRQTGNVRELLDAADGLVRAGVVDKAELQSVFKKLRDLGFDGVVENPRNILGRDVNPSNVLTVFDQNDLDIISEFNANREVVPSPDRAEIKEQVENRLESHKQRFDHRQQEEDLIDRGMRKVPQEVDTGKAFFKQAQNRLERLEELKEQGLIDQNMLDSVRDAIDKAKTFEKAMQAARLCAKRSL